MDKEWKRLCPKCNKELFYSHKSNFNAATKKNSLCRNCRVISDDTKEKHRQAKIGFHLTPDHREKLRNSWLGKHHTDQAKSKMNAWKKNVSEETRRKLRDARLGKTASDETREKLRNIKLMAITQLGGFPSYNRKACAFIDAIQSKLGVSLQHAMNGGEVYICGYSVDGYDKSKNIVFEYDEPRHENPSRKIKDIHRTKLMMEKTGCDVIRYSERFNRMYKSYPTHSEIINL